MQSTKRQESDMGEGMDIFGIQAHDDRHSETERLLRRIVEQVAQLSIDLGVTRTELRRLALDVAALDDATVKSDDIDPSLTSLNERIRDARASLDETKASASDTWQKSEAELFSALEQLRSELED